MPSESAAMDATIDLLSSIELSSVPPTLNNERFGLSSVPLSRRGSRKREAKSPTDYERKSHLQPGFIAPEKRRRRGIGSCSFR
jgi:hypothetical protein